MRARPLSDRIFVKPFPVETRMGILELPMNSQEIPLKGTVVAIGKGRHGIPMECSVGVEVMYGKQTGIPIEVEGEILLCMRDCDPICII